MGKPVVVPLDGSALAESALVPAITIAKRLKTGLHLVRVRQIEVLDPSVVDDVPWDDAYLLELGARLAEELGGEAITTAELEGAAADAVIGHARDAQARLIVMATRRHDGLTRTVLSSVTDNVVRHAALPVLLCGPETTPVERSAAWDCKRMLIPLDGSPLSRTIVQHAGNLAIGLDARITLLRVLAEPGATVGWPAIPYNRDDQAASDKESAVADLAAVADTLRAAGLIVTTRVVQTTLTPAEVIVNEAVDVGADMIALATRGHGPAKRFAFGSVAHELTRQVVAPMLLLAPGDDAVSEGFSVDLGS